MHNERRYTNGPALCNCKCVKYVANMQTANYCYVHTYSHSIVPIDHNWSGVVACTVLLSVSPWYGRRFVVPHTHRTLTNSHFFVGELHVFAGYVPHESAYTHGDVPRWCRRLHPFFAETRNTRRRPTIIRPGTRSFWCAAG